MAIIIINVVAVTEGDMVVTDMIQTVLMIPEGTIVVVQTGAEVVQAIITTEVTMIDIIRMIGMVDLTEEEGMTPGDTEIVIMMIQEVEAPVRERQVTMRKVVKKGMMMQDWMRL